MGDTTNLLRVVMNLCANGCQAMQPGGGTLTVELSEVELEQGAVAGLGAGHFAKLTVSDVGVGICVCQSLSIHSNRTDLRSEAGG